MEEIHDAVSCLQRLTALFRERRQALAASIGLSEQQWSVLEEIATEHFMPSLFARRSERSPAAVSKVLRQLMDKNYVEVSLSATDGRQRKYQLSGAGRDALARLRRERQRAIKKVWEHFDSTEVKSFTSFGVQLTRRLEDYARSEKESPFGSSRAT